MTNPPDTRLLNLPIPVQECPVNAVPPRVIAECEVRGIHSPAPKITHPVPQI
jgi:hypothetical protein